MIATFFAFRRIIKPRFMLSGPWYVPLYTSCTVHRVKSYFSIFFFTSSLNTFRVFQEKMNLCSSLEQCSSSGLQNPGSKLRKARYNTFSGGSQRVFFFCFSLSRAFEFWHRSVQLNTYMLEETFTKNLWKRRLVNTAITCRSPITSADYLNQVMVNPLHTEMTRKILEVNIPEHPFQKPV